MAKTKYLNALNGKAACGFELQSLKVYTSLCKSWPLSQYHQALLGKVGSLSLIPPAPASPPVLPASEPRDGATPVNSPWFITMLFWPGIDDFTSVNTEMDVKLRVSSGKRDLFSKGKYREIKPNGFEFEKGLCESRGCSLFITESETEW